MSSEQMKTRIKAQPQSLAGVLRHQCGEGATALREAAALMHTRRQLVLTGMGASYYASLPLESHLCGLGIHAIAVEAGELLHFRANAYRDAAIVVVSRSGESVEIARLLETLKGRQPIIGVTNCPDSRLAREADLTLSIHSEADDIVALQTYTGTLLTMALLGRSFEGTLAEAEDEVANFLPSYERQVAAALALIPEWDRFLDPGSSIYFLGRGGSYGSACEGALLFHETAKKQAVAMPAASFRHGPVEAVDANFRAFLFTPADSTHPLNTALARDLDRFGGQVRLIGPRGDGISSLPLIETPQLSPLFAPIFEIAPVQTAALRMAELRGIVPGEFRFASQVALDEASFPPLK
jgi:glutamine---fructose-6-phosphate transaminase (isomerizing)